MEEELTIEQARQVAALLPWPYHPLGRDKIHVARRALEQQAPAAPYPVDQEDPYPLAVEVEMDVEELSLEPAAPLVLLPYPLELEVEELSVVKLQAVELEVEELSVHPTAIDD